MESIVLAIEGLDGLTLSVMAAAAAMIFAGIGSAMGIGYTGQAASGVLSEDPDKFGVMLILVSLPGTQGFYGFVAAFLIILKVGLLGDAAPVSTAQGLQILGAALPIAFTGLLSGIHQGKVCAAGIGVAEKKPEHAMKAVIYGAFVETYAVLGLVITIFLLNGIHI